jgi:hypothetical protein
MGQYTDSVRTLNDLIDGTQTTIRDAFDLAAPTGDAPMVTHMTFFHKFTFAAAANVDVVAPISAAIKQLKLQIGNRTIVDYVNPLATILPASAKGDSLQVMMEKLGGSCYLYPYVNDTDTVVYSWIRIPVGVTFNGAQSKRVNMEIVYGGGTAATGLDGNAAAWGANGSSNITATELQVLCDYGISRDVVTIGTSRQFDHTASTQVVTISGDKSKGQMLGVLVANDTQADEFGEDGIRQNFGGFLGIPPQYIHFLNGDTTFGFNLGNNGGLTTAQQRFAVSPGATWVNCYRLSAGADVDLVVNSSETTTRYYFPVFVNTINSKDGAKPKQNIQTSSSVTASTMKQAETSQ